MGNWKTATETPGTGCVMIAQRPTPDTPRPLRPERAERVEGTPNTQRSSAFSLVELLVVIGIIVILIGILVPTISSVKVTAQVVKSKVRIRELSDGCEAFKLEKQYYPGQDDTSWTTAPNKYEGSQILAACLFEYAYGSIGGTPTTESKYADCKPDDLFTYGISTNCISDRFPSDYKTLPILYYPARLDQSGTSQYVENDNRFLTGSAGGWLVGSDPPKPFAEYITDNRFGTSIPHHPDAFLLIAAGKDRALKGTDDNVTNWK